MTVEEHLHLYARIRGIRNRHNEVNGVIQRMQLRKFKHVQSRQLSGGNKRKLSAAMALIGSPPIVFLDEPSTGREREGERKGGGAARGSEKERARESESEKEREWERQ